MTACMYHPGLAQPLNARMCTLPPGRRKIAVVRKQPSPLGSAVSANIWEVELTGENAQLVAPPPEHAGQCIIYQ